MTLATVFMVAIALGTDALSLAVGIGINGIRRREIYLVTLMVSIFHVFMPLAGLVMGEIFGRRLGNLAGATGAIVLLVIGGQRLVAGFKTEWAAKLAPVGQKPLAAAQPAQARVFSGLWGLVVLAASVSVDALAVGFGLGTLRFNLTLTVLIMGAVAGAMTLSGFVIGKQMGHLLGKKAQQASGLILIGIGVKLFFS